MTHDPFQSYSPFFGNYPGVTTPYSSGIYPQTGINPLAIAHQLAQHQFGQQGYAGISPYAGVHPQQLALLALQNPLLAAVLHNPFSQIGLQNPILASVLQNPFLAASLHNPMLGGYQNPWQNPLTQIGSQFGQASPFGQPGSPFGQTGSPFGQTGSPFGQTGSPFGQTGYPLAPQSLGMQNPWFGRGGW